MSMAKPTISTFAACLLAGACTGGAQVAPHASAQGTGIEAMAPDFSGIGHWINSDPLTMQRLKGKVVLVEFWTFDCINCIHVIPYVKQWHERYKDQGLVVVGVHTPENAHERVLENLEGAVNRFGISYPIAQDNDYKTWDAYGTRFWPALYLIDRSGKIVYRHYGEGDYDVTEARIRRALSDR